MSIVKGKITLLRVNEVGDRFGSTTLNDFIEAEVIFRIDSEQNKYFGFQLRNDLNSLTHEAMFDLLHSAFLNNKEIFFEYYDNPMKSTFIVFRIWAESEGLRIGIPIDMR